MKIIGEIEAIDLIEKGTITGGIGMMIAIIVKDRGPVNVTTTIEVDLIDTIKKGTTIEKIEIIIKEAHVVNIRGLPTIIMIMNMTTTLDMILDRNSQKT